MAELALLLNTESSLEGITDTSDVCNKYWYPEFAGWHGERYLKKLLRQILPMALYRTWEIFVDHQAQGSDCYLGITRLAEIAGRATRTMEKNMASLCAKQLLVERAERKIFRRAEGGTLQSRVVVVKDFRGLYALAHEYHEWTLADAYIAPDREVLSLLEHEPHLIAKLRRFENYRRLLYTRQPGPTLLPREEDRWFTEYQPELAFYAIAREGDAQAKVEKRDTLPAKPSAKQLPKDLAEGSLKRREREATLKTLERDSVDSADSSSLLKKEENIAERSYLQKSQQRDEAEGQPAEAHGVSTPTDSVPRDEASGLQDGITFSQHEYYPNKPPTSASREAQAVSGLQLADSFLAAIAGPFGDQSPKGTRTRLRACFQEAHLSDPAEIVMCLIRAYVVTRDTHTIRAEHCHPETGRVNRMPLFCAMVPRLAESSRRGPWWESDWQCIEEEIASDRCLAQWWQRHQFLLTAVEETLLDEPEVQQEEERPIWPEAHQEPTLPPVSLRRTHLSQTDQAREERAAYAHRVLRHIRKMAVPIHGASVLWEHVWCGNPLYHRYKGQEACALCFPDPEWPEEVRTLLHSIVASSEADGEQAEGSSHAISAEKVMTGLGAFDPGWVDRDKAYTYAIRLLNTIIDAGYVVEVFLELIGERYQVVVRGADGQLVCKNPEQIASLMEQAQNGTL